MVMLRCRFNHEVQTRLKGDISYPFTTFSTVLCGLNKTFMPCFGKKKNVWIRHLGHFRPCINSNPTPLSDRRTVSYGCGWSYKVRVGMILMTNHVKIKADCKQTVWFGVVIQW